MGRRGLPLPLSPDAPRRPFLLRSVYTPTTCPFPSLPTFAFSRTRRRRFPAGRDGGAQPEAALFASPSRGQPSPGPAAAACRGLCWAGSGDRPRGHPGAVGGRRRGARPFRWPGPARAGWGGGATTVTSGHGDRGSGSSHPGGGRPAQLASPSLARSVPERCFLSSFYLHSLTPGHRGSGAHAAHLGPRVLEARPQPRGHARLPSPPPPPREADRPRRRRRSSTSCRVCVPRTRPPAAPRAGPPRRAPIPYLQAPSLAPSSDRQHCGRPLPTHRGRQGWRSADLPSHCLFVTPAVFLATWV